MIFAPPPPFAPPRHGLASAAASAADTFATVKERSRIIVGIARPLAEHLGVTLEIVQTSGPNRVAFPLARKIDVVIVSFTIRPAPRKVADSSPQA